MARAGICLLGDDGGECRGRPGGRQSHRPVQDVWVMVGCGGFHGAGRRAGGCPGGRHRRLEVMQLLEGLQADEAGRVGLQDLRLGPAAHGGPGGRDGLLAGSRGHPSGADRAVYEVPDLPLDGGQLVQHGQGGRAVLTDRSLSHVEDQLPHVDLREALHLVEEW
eukprot:scaffold216297_cov31-Prasinocladus_malaysianus.AAC.1